MWPLTTFTNNQRLNFGAKVLRKHPSIMHINHIIIFLYITQIYFKPNVLLCYLSHVAKTNFL